MAPFVLMDQLFELRWWIPPEWIVVGQMIGPPLLRALALGLFTWYLAGAARRSFERATRRTGADANFRLLLGRLVYLLILGVGVITVMDAFGVPLSTLVTVVGVAGLGVSLALQDILKNFFAGTYLLFERPFRLGDVISVKDHRGVVETIGVRTTTLRTPENVHVMIPNAIVFSVVVANRTYERPVAASAEVLSDRPVEVATDRPTEVIAVEGPPAPAHALRPASAPGQPPPTPALLVAGLKSLVLSHSLVQLARCRLRRFRV